MTSSAATYGRGWTVKQVTIRELDPVRQVARCIDTEGQWIDAATSLHRTGIRPRAGQIWIVDRDLGAWTLRALFQTGPGDPLPPEDGPWTPLELQSGWTASGSASDSPPVARVTGGGLIEFTGVINPGTLPAFGSSVAVAALPDGFPEHYRTNAILATSMGTGIDGPFMCGSLSETGTVSVWLSTSYTPTFLDLTGLRARVREP